MNKNNKLLLAGTAAIFTAGGLWYYFHRGEDPLAEYQRAVEQSAMQDKTGSGKPYTPPPPVRVEERKSAYGVICDILYHSELSRYSVKCHGKNKVFSKGPEFRTKEDAIWYMEKVMHGGKTPTEEVKKWDTYQEEGAAVAGKKSRYEAYGRYKGGDGKIYHILMNYSYKWNEVGRYMVRDPDGIKPDKFYGTWMAYQTDLNALRPPPELEDMEEPGATTTTPDTPAARAEFMGYLSR